MGYWEGKKVLVTGAGGFIGSHLSEELAKSGADVRALIHYNSSGSIGNLRHLPPQMVEELEIIQGDVQDPFCAVDVVKGCDVVLHLAALVGIPYSYVAPESYVATNVQGTLNVMQACRDHDVEKVVHTSTSEVYGTAVYTPINEAHRLRGQSPYSASKIGGDKIAESYHLSFELPVATIRPFNVYGPRQSARAVIPTIISQALAPGGAIRLGSKSPVRDFTFVSDTVRAFMKIAESPLTVGEVVNVGYGKGITIGDLAEKIVVATGTEGRVVSDDERIRPVKSEVRELLCDNGLAFKIVDWQPQIDIDEGLALTIAHIRDHLSSFSTDAYQI